MQKTLKVDFIICISSHIERVFFEKLSDNNEINKENLQLLRRKLTEISNYAFLEIEANT